MKREEKQQIIDELTVLFGTEQNYYLADASGLNAAQVSDLRRLCFSKGIQLKVAKNTLISKALQAQTADLSSVDSILKGPTAIFISDDMKAPAKLILDFRKKKTKPELKAAIIGGTDVFIGDNQLETLTKLKTKNELIGEVIGLLQSPAKNVISALQASAGQKIAGLVKTLQDRPE